MKTNKGSILIVTLLILFAAAVFALLSLNSIKFLIINSGLTYQYLASKYLTKGASEVELLKSKKYVFGIEDEIGSGSDTVKKNLKLKYRGTYFETTATALSSGRVCVDGGLSGIIWPLFWWGQQGQELPLEGGEFKSPGSIDGISILATGDVIVALIPEDIEEMYLNPSKYKIVVNGASFATPISLNSLNYNSDEKNFLIILVRSGEDRVCLESSTQLPAPYQRIYTFSRVGKFRLGEKIIKQLKLPGWLIYMVIGS